MPMVRGSWAPSGVFNPDVKHLSVYPSREAKERSMDAEGSGTTADTSSFLRADYTFSGQTRPGASTVASHYPPRSNSRIVVQNALVRVHIEETFP